MSTSTLVTLGVVVLAVYIFSRFVSKQVTRGFFLALAVLAALGALSHPGDVVNWFSGLVSKTWPFVLDSASRAAEAFLGLLRHLTGGGWR